LHLPSEFKQGGILEKHHGKSTHGANTQSIFHFALLAAIFDFTQPLKFDLS
jgi:hypothetical protein